MRFDSYHPAINLIFFASAIGCTVCFNHPVFVMISYTMAFAYSVKLNGRRALTFNICLIPAILAYGWFYSYYNHFGVTVLGKNFIDNSMTLESLVYGMVLGIVIASVIMWASCMFAVFSSDKVVYLFGRISPRLSLFISMVLRAVPRIKERAGRINISRRGIGCGAGDGNPVKKLLNTVRLISILITWSLENFVESAQSMKSRGYTLKGRTAFSIYRFDNRDRAFTIAVCACMTMTVMAALLDQTSIYYDPEIIFNRITAVSYIFYISYAVLLAMPMALQIAGEIKFRRISMHALDMERFGISDSEP